MTGPWRNPVDELIVLVVLAITVAAIFTRLIYPHLIEREYCSHRLFPGSWLSRRQAERRAARGPGDRRRLSRNAKRTETTRSIEE